MLRLSKLTDYGMVVMTALADDPRSLRNAAEIAGRTRVAPPTVRKLLKRLTREALVESTRGAHGGYRLARPPREISVAAVITALEGPIGLTECAAHAGVCSIETDCRLRGHWRLINAAVREALTGITLADMARPERGLRVELPTARTRIQAD